jgi:hypothetical protein
MAVKSTAITDFFNNQAAAISGRQGHWGAPQRVYEKNLQKRLDKFREVRHYS